MEAHWPRVIAVSDMTVITQIVDAFFHDGSTEANVGSFLIDNRASIVLKAEFGELSFFADGRGGTFKPKDPQAPHFRLLDGMIRWGNEWEPWSSILMDRFVRTYEMEHSVEKYLPKKSARDAEPGMPAWVYIWLFIIALGVSGWLGVLAIGR